MANQHTRPRPLELRNVTETRAYAGIETAERIRDSWRRVEQLLDALEDYAGVERPSDHAAEEAAAALRALPEAMDAFERTVQTKLPVLRNRIAKITVS